MISRFLIQYTPVYDQSIRVSRDYEWPSFVSAKGLSYEKLRQTQRARFSHRFTGEVYYDVIYNFDKTGFRSSTNNPKAPSRHWVLMGDSFAFGWGLGDNETLDSMLNQQNIYISNRAMPGTSINDFEKQNPNRLDLVSTFPNNADEVIYIFTQEQLERLLMSLNSFWYNKNQVINKAYYEFVEDRPQYLGSFKNSRIVQNQIYNLLSKFNLAQLLIYTPLFNYKEVDTRLFLLLMNSLNDEISLKIKFKKKFYFVIYPQTPTYLVEQLKKFIDPGKWSILDLSQIIVDNKFDRIPIDGHPNKNLNLKISTELLSKIN